MRATYAIVLMAALGLVPNVACTQASPRQAGRGLRPGDHEFSLRHGGRRRTYLVHVPPGVTRDAPVLLAFHGGGGNAGGFARYAELDRLADRERFLVVYPNGTGPLPNRLLTWNAGDGCCGYALTNSVNDVGYATTVLADLESRIAYDRRRVYATGHSNGAILAHRLAAERSGLIAAIAPVAGALDVRAFAPGNPVAVLQIHSVDDPRALYAGGLGPPFPGTDNRVFHQPVQAGLDRWIVANGCGTRPDTLDRRRTSPGSPEQTATLLVWRGCRGGVEVRHWKLTGSGHGWPGNSRPPGGESISGPQTTLVNAADEIWAFVSRFRSP